MNAPLTTTSLTTPITKNQQYQHGFSVEESRDKRLQRQQARFRDRGGIYVPKPRGTLLDILLKGGPSPTKDGRRSRSRSRSQSPMKGGGQKKGKGKSQRDVNEKSNPKAKKRKSVVQKEEIPAGPSTLQGVGVSGRRTSSRTTQSRSKKGKADELTASEEATAQSKSKRRRSTTSKVASTFKGKEREGVEEDAPKPKRARTTRKAKAAESDNLDAGTGEEEHGTKEKPPVKARTRKSTAKRKTPAKADRKAKAQAADLEEDEESGGEKGTSEPMTQKAKGSRGRAQAKASAKSRGRAKVKQDIPQGAAKETESGPTTISVNRGKRRADKAKSQSNYGGLSVIAEEEEPISQMPPELGSDVEKPHTNAVRGTKESNMEGKSGPDEMPSETLSAQTPSVGSRKRKQDEVLPPPDPAPSRKKAKSTPVKDIEKGVTRVSEGTSGRRGRTYRKESDTSEDAAGVASSAEQPTNSKPSTSRKRELNETRPAEKSKSARKATSTKRPSVDDVVDVGTDPPVKKKTKIGHAEDSETGERLKTTSRRQKENSKASGGSPSRKKIAPKSSTSKEKKPASATKRKGPPKEVLEQIKRSQPHIEDGEPDELDLLT
ncbi:hypothetical protein L218DRAFT_224626 [Marasmius fiardii PR-910]|nr:hypothetical protein L218DRAFT_224626 [Marasmius fiardii PR-910]